MDVSLATKARANLPSFEKSLTMAMLYRAGMSIAVLLPPAISGVRNRKSKGAAPLPLVSCGPSFVRPAIARFPMGETWTGIKESSNG
jgi:hypothetical protein